jgi:hypothetical protein
MRTLLIVPYFTAQSTAYVWIVLPNYASRAQPSLRELVIAMQWAFGDNEIAGVSGWPPG